MQTIHLAISPKDVDFKGLWCGCLLYLDQELLQVAQHPSMWLRIGENRPDMVF